MLKLKKKKENSRKRKIILHYVVEDIFLKHVISFPPVVSRF